MVHLLNGYFIFKSAFMLIYSQLVFYLFCFYEPFNSAPSGVFRIINFSSDLVGFTFSDSKFKGSRNVSLIHVFFTFTYNIIKTYMKLRFNILIGFRRRGTQNLSTHEQTYLL